MIKHINSSQNWMTNPIVNLGDQFKDDRGSITSLISLMDPSIGSVVIIESKKGAVRANHYHKKDWHYCYVLSGKIDYYAREVNSNEEPIKTTVCSNQLFYTPSLLEHAMYFPEDCVFLTFGGGSRTQEDYESDLVRVKLI
ncbi:hypothetical protein DID78_00195 [Candidatus Marinamargulisbacteria bacterium SCGC AG-343-D04]|nr:hypothetical protein DID78_00195 [Candidatus Marinamargulisbacteria bacterium SCGC AG-343-D04]